MLFNKDKELKKKIAEALNLSSFTEHQQDEIISGLTNNISEEINITILDLLTKEEKIELEKIVEKNGDAPKYLNSKIEDFPSLLEEVAKKTIEDFKKRRSAKQ